MIGTVNMQCDDGNTVSGDGCSATCQVEAGWQCSGGNPFEADLCKNILCGDGIPSVGPRDCDDGNTVGGDGCTSNCIVEEGVACDNSVSPSVCTELCGDGRNMGVSACDDENSISGDGCDNLC